MAPPDKPHARVVDGARWPLRGARTLLAHRELWQWVAIPALITTASLITSVYTVVRYTPALLAWLWPLAPDASALMISLWWTIAAFLMAAFVTLAALGAYLGSGLVSLPFLDQLSSRVEAREIGPRETATSWGELFGDIGLSFAHTLLGLLTWAAAMIALVLVGLIPVVGPPTEVILSFAVSALLVSREMMDGPMSRRRFGFVHKMRIVLHNRWTMLGFGLVVSSLLWVPLLNFVLLPVSVVGGTLMFLHLEREGLVPPAHGE